MNTGAGGIPSEQIGADGGNIGYLDGSGRWKHIDNTLVYVISSGSSPAQWFSVCSKVLLPQVLIFTSPTKPVAAAFLQKKGLKEAGFWLMLLVYLPQKWTNRTFETGE